MAREKSPDFSKGFCPRRTSTHRGTARRLLRIAFQIKAIATTGIRMTLRSIAGLVLGLVLQIILVVPTGGWVPTERCEMQPRSCCCCDGERSCPCISDSGEGEKAPAPVVPPDRPLKVDAVVPSGLAGIVPAVRVNEQPGHLPGPFLVPVAGYSGVSLPVAFCRLVI